MNTSAMLANPFVQSYAPISQPPRCPRILYVDDNALVREGICSGLVKKGWYCRGFASGAEALQWLAAGLETFDLIITDHQMPEMNGLEFVKNVWATAFTGKILVHSTMLTASEHATYEALNVAAIVPKDGKLERLTNAILALQQIP
jgi:DNA-binding NarL/FixJ family response regulator